LLPTELPSLLSHNHPPVEPTHATPFSFDCEISRISKENIELRTTAFCLQGRLAQVSAVNWDLRLQIADARRGFRDAMFSGFQNHQWCFYFNS
jgi:hypothetical protein